MCDLLPEDFVDLHRHGHKSPDSFDTEEQIVERAIELGQRYVCLSDHGNMSGLPELMLHATKAGLGYVFGVEAYYQHTYCNEMPPRQSKKKNAPLLVLPPVSEAPWARHHFGILVKTQQGWNNLVEMHNHAVINQNVTILGRHVPIYTWNDLVKWHEGLIYLSGCISSIISRYILDDNLDMALSMIQELKRLKGEDFYLEVQPTGGEAQRKVNAFLDETGRVLNIKRALTTDAHYLRPEDADKHRDALAYVGKKKNDPERIASGYAGKHPHTVWQLSALWRDMMGTDGDEYIKETRRIAEQCHATIKKHYAPPNLSLSEEPEEELRHRAESGLASRLREAGRLERGRIPKVYLDRIDYEVELFRESFIPYILMCGNIAHYCAANNIFCNLRGSGGGSLLLYALGCTPVDAVFHGTSIERFYRPGKKAPDADFDVRDDLRGKVIEHLIESYPGRARQIVDYGTLKPASLVNALAPMFDLNSVDIDRIKHALTLLGKVDVSMDMMRKSPTIAEYAEQHPRFLEMIEYCREKFNFYGTHAAAVLITNDALDATVPLVRVGPKNAVKYLTSWSMHDLIELEEGCKVDVMGVKNLRLIALVLELLGIPRPKESWIYDPNVFLRLRNGWFSDVFQFGSRSARQMLIEAQVQCFEDVVALIGLNRPSALESGAWDIFAKGAVPNRWQEPVTRKTRGAMVFQEQWRELFLMLGLDQLTCDRIEKYAKKPRDDDPELHKAVYDACIAYGMSRLDAEETWRTARLYGFNLAHAVSYAMITCWQTFLMHYYPQAYYFASLIAQAGGDEQVAGVERSAQRKGIPMLLPHVNGGHTYTQVRSVDTTDETVLFRRGLERIDKVGPTVARKIEQERLLHGYYTSADDVRTRCHLASDKYEALLTAGALEFNRERLLEMNVEEQYRL